MFKKIMFTGVLLISISALKAKSIAPFNTIAPVTVLKNTNEDIVSKLVADDNFRNYYTNNVVFANKIIENKAGSLFYKYIQNTISAEEQVDLFTKMKVNSKEEFNAIGVNLKKEAVAFLNKFPELKQMPEKTQKETLINAFGKISTDKSIAVEFVKAKYITYEQCFWIWMACNGLCALSCTYEPPGNYGDCMFTCGTACAASYGLCWFLVAE